MFVHLHIHSHYSFLDGTLSVAEIVAAAARAGMEAVALTDTNGLYAAVPFVKACRAAGIKPILGAEIDGFDPEEVFARLEEAEGKRRKSKVKSEAEGAEGTRGRGDAETRGGTETRGRGDAETRRPGDAETRGTEGRSRDEGGGMNQRISSVLHPSSFIPHPSSFVLHPSSFGLHPFDVLRVVVLARDDAGYAELSRLITQRRLLETEEEVGQVGNRSQADTEPRVGPVGNPSELRIADCGLRMEPLKTRHAKNEPTVRTPQFKIQHSKFTIRFACSAIRNPQSAILPLPRSRLSPPSRQVANLSYPQPAIPSLLDSLLALSEEHVWILSDSPALLRLLAGRRNVFAELILTPRRRGLCRTLYDLAAALRLPVVAAGDVHFARREDYPLYRLLAAIRTQKTIETLDDDAEVENGRIADCGLRIAESELDYARRGEEPPPVRQSVTRSEAPNSKFNIQNSTFAFPHPQSAIRNPQFARRLFADDEHYFKTPDELARAFRGLRAALRNTRYIAERCNVEWTTGDPPLLGGWKFPRVTLPPDESAFSYLWKVTFDGLKQRYRPLTPEATRRLEYELGVISRLGFAEYFLAVHEIAEEARQRGWLFLGRGSAANSIVSFALGFTPVDPIRHNLYFERFLNPERRSPPDIDLDFSWKERDEVVQWIFDHFGRDRVALIATHITLQPRQAIREVGKVMGLTEAEVNRFTRPIPGWISEAQNLTELPNVFPECRNLPVGEEPWKTILAHAERLLDFPRHLSIHCGGLLITPEPITNYTPLQRAAKGTIITQMEMHAIEDLGLIKMDILGNRSLGVLGDCLKVLAE